MLYTYYYHMATFMQKDVINHITLDIFIFDFSHSRLELLAN
jgi:hypothetical protein